MRRSRRIRLDMTNTVNTETRCRELSEVNNGLIQEERNTARAYLTRMTTDLQTRTTERDDARALLEQRTEELEAITTKWENLQNRLTDAKRTLTQLETELQTRTTERNNVRSEVRQVRTELETIRTEQNNLYMDRYATCRQYVGRFQGQL